MRKLTLRRLSGEMRPRPNRGQIFGRSARPSSDLRVARSLRSRPAGDRRAPLPRLTANDWGRESLAGTADQGLL
jgi:hypothetical protein